jgi:uncharacterized protein
MKIIKGFFARRQDHFLPLLLQQAELTLQGLTQLQEYMQNNNEKAASQVTETEQAADEIRHILINELNRTFITPIDREDILNLSRAIDDVMDYAYTTVDEMNILKVESNPFLTQMVSLLRDAGDEIHLAVHQLKDHPGVADDHAQRAKSFENQVEAVYREAIADLFHGPAEPKHIMKLLKLREVYRHLSNAADRADEAANIISDIVVKMT